MSVAIFGHDGISINDILPDLSQVLELIFIFTQHNTTQHTRTHQVEKISHTHTHTHLCGKYVVFKGRSSSVSESAEDARIGVASASHLHLIFLFIILLLAPTLHEEITNRRCDQIL